MSLIVVSADAARGFAHQLEQELGDRSTVRLGLPGEALPDSAPVEFAVSAYASLPDTVDDAMGVVKNATEALGAHVDRDELLDLLVVTPTSRPTRRPR